MAYIDQYTTAHDSTFLQKLRMAAMEAAIDVMAEASSTAGHEQRASLAKDILLYPDGRVQQIAEAVCASDDTITTATADATLKTAVASVWNALAGYSAN